MRTLKTAVTVAAVLLTSACVTSNQDYQSFVDGWIGSTQEALIAQFGAPMTIETVDSTTMVAEWQYSTETDQMTGPTAVGSGVTANVGLRVEYVCTLSFRLVDDVVVGAQWKTTRDAIFKDEEVDVSTTYPCNEGFPIPG